MSGWVFGSFNVSAFCANSLIMKMINDILSMLNKRCHMKNISKMNAFMFCWKHSDTFSMKLGTVQFQDQ